MRPRLATRFAWTILGIVALSILSGGVALYAAWRVNKRLELNAREGLPSIRADEMKILFRERSARIADYLLDNGNPAWLERLKQLQPRFQEWISTVRNLAYVPEQESLLVELEKTWADLDHQQDQVIALYKQGDAAAAKAILVREINGRLAKEADRLCDQLIAVNDRYVGGFLSRADARIHVATWVVVVSGVMSLLLGGFLLWMFFYRILFPLRGMVADTQLFHSQRDDRPIYSGIDELHLIGNHLRNLLSDMSDTRSQLERSHDRLAAVQKLASVGKLAACVAHEIRNPLTAIKMWLFSIQESTQGDAELGRKLGIVSEEIMRLENIVRRFLEFSRPPAIRCQPLDVCAVIRQTLELLGPRLAEANVTVEQTCKGELPRVMADASQLKQVLLNLLGNAVDAMPGGGDIRIDSTTARDADGRPMVVVRVCDSGSGMPRDVQDRVFEPFFTTKENGTGLGLCIAAQVMARHDGALVLESSTEKGTTFAVWIPTAAENRGGV